jgi:hypothetical protein
MAADSLLMPTETFVLTRADLANYNIHTLEDILSLVPGLSWWREGPPAAYSGFSVEGRSSRGVNLFLNGEPVIDAYRLEALMKFLPLSRLERVEILYSGSPVFTGDLSSRGAVNLVIEEGGREAPLSRLDFTYGKAKRRARRAWFATPRAHIGGVLAYDEYLQDGVECIPALPGRIIGRYDSRSMLTELLFNTPAEEEVLIRFRRYEDTYVGSIVSAAEDVRWSGFSSLVSYRRSAIDVSLSQHALSLSRRNLDLNVHTLSGCARWSGSFGPFGMRCFATAEDASYANSMRGSTFEIALSKTWADRFSQDVVIARRLRVPSAQELYEPAITVVTGWDTLYSTAGSADLAPEISDEISLGFRAPHWYCSVFGRSETSVIIRAGGERSIYRSEGSGLVAGARGRFDIGWRLFGVNCSLALGGEGYPEREALARGVPSYRARAEIGLERRLFKQTESFSVGVASEFVGTRSWEAAEIPACYSLDLNASITVMSARVRFELRNLLDEQYETVPGFTMPGRYYTIGIIWELFD